MAIAGGRDRKFPTSRALHPKEKGATNHGRALTSCPAKHRGLGGCGTGRTVHRIIGPKINTMRLIATSFRPGHALLSVHLHGIIHP